MRDSVWNSTLKHIPLHVKGAEHLTSGLPEYEARAVNAAFVLWKRAPGQASANELPEINNLPMHFTLDPDSVPGGVRRRVSSWLRTWPRDALRWHWKAVSYYPHWLPKPFGCSKPLWMPLTPQSVGWAVANPDIMAVACGDWLWRAVWLYRLQQLSNWILR